MHFTSSITLDRIHHCFPCGHRKAGSVFPLGKNSTNSDIYLTHPRNHAGARLRFAWHRLLRAPARQNKELPRGRRPRKAPWVVLRDCQAKRSASVRTQKDVLLASGRLGAEGPPGMSAQCGVWRDMAFCTEPGKLCITWREQQEKIN